MEKKPITYRISIALFLAWNHIILNKFMYVFNLTYDYSNCCLNFLPFFGDLIRSSSWIFGNNRQIYTSIRLISFDISFRYIRLFFVFLARFDFKNIHNSCQFHFIWIPFKHHRIVIVFLCFFFLCNLPPYIYTSKCTSICSIVLNKQTSLIYANIKLLTAAIQRVSAS